MYTDADGHFLLAINGALPDDKLKVQGNALLPQRSYPYIAEPLELLLGHAVYPGVENFMGRPIYLPELDRANEKHVLPTQDARVTTTAIEHASVFIAAGTALTPEGDPYTGTISITEVPLFDFQSVSGFTGTLPPYWRLIDPLGRDVFLDAMSGDRTVNLTMTGAYTLLVEGRVEDAQPQGNFTFNVERLDRWGCSNRLRGLPAPSAAPPASSPRTRTIR